MYAAPTLWNAINIDIRLSHVLCYTIGLCYTKCGDLYNMCCGIQNVVTYTICVVLYNVCWVVQLCCIIYVVFSNVCCVLQCMLC